VRAVRLEDLDQLWDLIEHATYGLTTLQISKEQLADRIELSHFAFTRKVERPSGEPYVMVMEDLVTRALVGLSCIFGKTGGFEPFYSYRRAVETHHCEHLNLKNEVELLVLEKMHDGPTEIGSLFLLPEYRGQGRGRLLSLSRFVFMTLHPKRFSDRVIAEMRGVSSENGHSPFWDAILQHFFGMQFPQADRLSTISKRFIEDMMPNHPIYTCLLSEETRSIMGQVHPNTEPALAMLESEGFAKTDCIDIFDGGPLVACKRDNIDAVKRTAVTRVVQIGDVPDSSTVILASECEGFRATLGPMKLIDNGLIISEAVASALRLNVNDEIRFTTLHSSHANSKV
jgi:arginine N-succinyltransferase